MSDRLPPIIISARDEASDDFQKVGRAGQKMGQDVDRGAEQGKRGLRGFSQSAKDVGNSLDEIGAAVGVVVGAMSLLGRNSRDAERETDALRLAYRGAADQIIDFTEAIQDSTNFSNDAARQAALTASTLTREYGLTADQAQILVERSADLAQIYGIDLEGAVNRTASAIRGEAEAAEYLGIAMADSVLQVRAAELGMDGWTTTMTEGEKAQVRFGVLLEQTTYATGAAGQAAEGAAGRAQDFVHWLDDTAESAGEMLGPVGESLAVMGNVALAAPLAGAALGRMAQGMGRVAESQRAANLATGALTLATNPLVLAVGGVAAAAGLAYIGYQNMREAQDDLRISTDEIADSAEGLIDTLVQLQSVGASQATLTNVRTYAESILEIGRASNTVDPDDIRAIGEQIDFLNATLGHPNLSAGQAAVLQTQLTALRDLEAQMSGMHVTQAEFEQGLEDINTVLSDASRLNYPELLARVVELDQLHADGTITADEYLRLLRDLADGVDTYGLSLDGLAPKLGVVTTGIGDVVSGLTETASGLLDFGQNAARAADDVSTLTTEADNATSGSASLGDEIDSLGASIGDADAALGAIVGTLESHAAAGTEAAAAVQREAEALEEHEAALAAHAEGQARVTAGIEAGTTARETGRAAQQAHRDELRAEAEATIAARDAALELLSVRDDEIATLAAIAAPHAAHAAMLADTEAAYLSAADGVAFYALQTNILTTEIGESESSLRRLTDAEDILRARQAEGQALSAAEIDFLNRVDDAQANLTDTIEDNTVALGLQELAMQDGAAEGETLAGSIDTLGGIMGDLVDTIRELHGLPPLGDTLAVPDDVSASWRGLRDDVLGAMAAVRNEANFDEWVSGMQANAGMLTRGGFAPPNQPPPPLPVDATTIVPRLGPRPEPIVVPILADAGPITATLTVVENDLTALTRERWTADLFGNAADLNRTAGAAEAELDRVTDRTYIADILANASNAYGNIAGVRAELNALDGGSATVFAYANTVNARNAIAGLTGYQGDAWVNVYTNTISTTSGGSAPFQHGGVVGYAHGGVIPEAIPHAQHGRVVMVGESGPELAYLPGGTYVSPSPASRGAMGGMRPNVGPITINVYARDGRDAGRQIRGYLEGIG